MGAIVNRLDLPPVNGEKSLSRDSLAYLGTTPLTGNRAAIAALKASDLVLDLMTLLFSPEQHEILGAGTKILLAVEPPEVLARMVPTEADRSRVKAAATARRAREGDARRLRRGHRLALSARRVSGHQRVRLRRRAGTLGPLAERLRADLAGRRRRERPHRDRPRRHPAAA